jgi:hypothetical protein
MCQAGRPKRRTLGASDPARVDADSPPGRQPLYRPSQHDNGAAEHSHFRGAFACHPPTALMPA